MAHINPTYRTTPKAGPAANSRTSSLRVAAKDGTEHLRRRYPIQPKKGTGGHGNQDS